MSLHSCAFSDCVSVPNTTMKQFETSLCMNYKDDPYTCIDCEHACPNGNLAIQRLEKETRKKMTYQRKGASILKINAMSNYVEALESEDPIKFIMSKYGIESEKTAKAKLYQWQHNYGVNGALIIEKIKQLKNELGACEAKTDKVSSEEKKPVITSESTVKPVEEKKMTKRQEEKISQGRLEQMRLDLEKEYLEKESEIATHKKEIEHCEQRMTAITSEITAIRQVLEIFKKKDELYV